MYPVDPYRAQYPQSQYPQPQYAHPQHPYLQPAEPPAGTAIAAVVLAYSGAGAAALSLFNTVPIPANDGAGPFWTAVIALEAVVLVLLAAGATMMLTGFTAGRWLVVAGCAVLIAAVGVLSTIMVVYTTNEVRDAAGKPTPLGGDWSALLAWGVGIAVVFLVATVVVPAALTAGLTLASSTKRWVERPRIR